MRDEDQGWHAPVSPSWLQAPSSSAIPHFQGSWVPPLAPGSETLKALSLGDVQSVAEWPVSRHPLGVNIDKLE